MGVSGGSGCCCMWMTANGWNGGGAPGRHVGFGEVCMRNLKVRACKSKLLVPEMGDSECEMWSNGERFERFGNPNIWGVHSVKMVERTLKYLGKMLEGRQVAGAPRRVIRSKNESLQVWCKLIYRKIQSLWCRGEIREYVETKWEGISMT